MHTFCSYEFRSEYSKEKTKKKLINHKHNRFRSAALNYFIIFLSINFLVIAVSLRLTQHSCIYTHIHAHAHMNNKKTHLQTCCCCCCSLEKGIWHFEGVFKQRVGEQTQTRGGARRGLKSRQQKRAKAKNHNKWLNILCANTCGALLRYLR